MKRKGGKRRSLSLTTILVVMAMLMAAVSAVADDAPVLAATEKAPQASNTITIADIATLADAPVLSTGETGTTDTREMMIRLEDPTAFGLASGSVYATIATNAGQKQVVLAQAMGWQVRATLSGAIDPAGCVLTGVDLPYAVTVTGDEIVFYKEEARPEAIQAEAFDPSRLGVTVTLGASRDGVALDPAAPVYYGDMIHLQGSPVNPEGLPFALQWQCDSGAGWMDIEGATGDGHAFILDADNALWQFRLIMQVETGDQGKL